jgi:hypothetical protein
MEQPIIPPMIPTMGNLEAAAAGNSAVIFTAADRKIIEERSGELDRNRTFLDVFREKPLMAKVENEQTSVKPETDTKEIESRQKGYRAIIKNSALIPPPQERVEITGRLPDTYEEKDETPSSVNMEENTKPTTKTTALTAEAAAVARELNLNPSDIFDKFSLEQEELTSLIYRIKDLHLKRLLTEDEKEFSNLSRLIKEESLHSVKPEARPWFESQLDQLMAGAVKYKLGILDSLQVMAFDHHRDKMIGWLKKRLKSYASEV